MATDVMKKSTFEAITFDIQNYKGLGKECEEFIVLKYPNVSRNSISSILSTVLQRLMKINYRKAKGISAKYYNSYLKCIENGEEPGVMLRLSVQQGITPSLFARSVLAHLYSSGEVNQYMKDTTKLEDKDMAYEVYLCILADNNCGLITDTIKHSIGREYEIRLERELRLLKTTFLDENDLRARGYDKTPDFKLDVPIAVDGFIINWVESKASFGDEINHAGYLKDQLLCYWNRFGPGLVIYWFGYVDVLEHHPETNNLVILRTSFPSRDSITILNPEFID